MLALPDENDPLNTPLNVNEVVWCEPSSVNAKVSEKGALVKVSGVEAEAELNVRSSVATMSEAPTA